MQHVTGEIERQRLLRRGDLREVTARARFLELLERLVRALHVRLVMLVVMQLHDAGRKVRLERAEIVRQVGKHVLGHDEVSASKRSPKGSITNAAMLVPICECL